MIRSRSFIPFLLPFLLCACATAGGTFAPLGPEHPASTDAPEVAIADPSAVLRAREAPVERAPGAYVCPMHPEVASDQPGSCPKCGMKFVAREQEQHEEQDHDR